MKSARPSTTASLQRKPRLPIEGLLCSFTHRSCSQERLEGYDYCLKHILEDKNAPFKQCNYISNKTGKRCSSAAPKTDRKDGYCMEHASRALSIRHRAHRKRRPKESAETLLNSMEHYMSSGKGNGGGGANNGGIEPRRLRGADSVANRALEYATSSESESEGPLVDQAWRGDCDSDAESIDSEQEDPLKHAGIYTAEEVALIARDKLIRLQSLYIDQFKRLQHLMKEKRRRYLHNVKQERDAYGGVHVGEDGGQQRDKFERLLATKRYHHRFGKEALVHRQSKERRIAVSEGANYKPPAYPKCIHQPEGTGGAKCGARAIPLSKFCLQHIQHDPHQVLYKSCDYGDVCTRPVAKMSPDCMCPLHCQPRPLEQRYPRPVEMDDEEMREESSIDVVGSPEVKFELPMETDQPEPSVHRVPDTIMAEDKPAADQKGRNTAESSVKSDLGFKSDPGLQIKQETSVPVSDVKDKQTEVKVAPDDLVSEVKVASDDSVSEIKGESDTKVSPTNVKEEFPLEIKAKSTSNETTSVSMDINEGSTTTNVDDKVDPVTTKEDSVEAQQKTGEN